MNVTLRAQWRKLENEAIARGEYFDITAAGKSLNDALAPLIAQHARGTVLDAGAGRLAHRPSVLRAPRVERYVSIDYAGDHDDLSALGDLLKGLPFPEDTFDCVICSQVLEHVSEPPVALSELARVLAADGTLLLTVPHISFVHGAPDDYYRFTRYGVSHLLRQAGLVPLSVKPAGGILSLLTTPLSMGLLLVSELGPFAAPARQVARWINGGLVGASRWIESCFDPERIFALNVVAVARKPKGWLARQ